ncbi:ankyrin [Gonapodya prolifera JEL478]|uniref:Ankyrin n=1 Tax=Gonapodya prolifera (strain JEL478) TaxID=1344416 RepID=A0A139AS25_GONPJ|nr:ankyrin [Gonapodya prolifera JEL478]|eukprot:KXS19556.1 ankyrin [Gonapodya prolifera JEL478]
MSLTNLPPEILLHLGTLTTHRLGLPLCSSLLSLLGTPPQIALRSVRHYGDVTTALAAEAERNEQTALDVVRAILESQPTAQVHAAINTEARHPFHCTPLIRAIGRRNVPVATFLLDRGADLHACKTAPDTAARPPCPLCIDTPHRGVEMDNGAVFAVRNDDVPMLQLLLSRGASTDLSPEYSLLSIAVWVRSYATASYLLRHHGANGRGSANALFHALHNRDAAMTRLLLAHGSDPNSVQMALSALETAARTGEVETIQALLDNGARLGEDGHKAMAAAQAGGHEGVVRVLARAGVQPSANRDEDDDTCGDACDECKLTCLGALGRLLGACSCFW